VVSERTIRRDAALQEIGATWGGFQTVGGPVLTVPYRHTWTERDGRVQQATAQAVFLPDTLEMASTVGPLMLQRGLFKVAVYRSHVRVTGTFMRPDLSAVRPLPSEVLWDEATVSVGVADPRGLARRASFNWMRRDVALEPGVADVAIFTSGLRGRVPGLAALAERTAMPFALELDVNGSRDLRFLPVGSDTSVQMTSTWPHPSFIGA